MQIEIAQRILGNTARFGVAIIDVLIGSNRGALGYYDLLLFRLRCSMDRGAQTHALFTALLRHEDSMATVSGQVTLLTIASMRRLSQEVFKRFLRDYIDRKLNFFLEVDKITDEEMFGDAGVPTGMALSDCKEAAEVARSAIKSFVIYQLTNNQQPDGVGIGCGFYDATGETDTGGIKIAMITYLLDFCFNPLVSPDHARVFVDFCLRGLRDAKIEALDAVDSELAAAALTKLLPIEQLRSFWIKYGAAVKRNLANEGGAVLSYKFKATYQQWFPIFTAVLDGMAAEAT